MNLPHSMESRFLSLFSPRNPPQKNQKLVKIDRSAHAFGANFTECGCWSAHQVRVPRPQGTAIPPLRTRATTNLPHRGRRDPCGAISGRVGCCASSFPSCALSGCKPATPPDPRACTSNPPSRSPRPLPQCTRRREPLQNETIGRGFDLLSKSLWGSP